MTPPTVWTGRLEFRCRDSPGARRLFRVLGPESEREVPRARARLVEPVGTELVLELSAGDTGALRAALQTFLGWVQLADATERSAGPSAGD